MPSERLVVAVPPGVAWVDFDLPADGSDLLLVIGHGAGGSVQAPDLLAVRAHAVAAGVAVARVTQPYRVAGKKAPPQAPMLDAAWQAAIRTLATHLPGRRLVYGGRSSGARVACRTASGAVADRAVRADSPNEPLPAVPAAPVAVLALAFPLHPPGRPDKSRIAELDAVGLPTLVVQGLKDPFGMPPPALNRRVVGVPGDHSLKSAAEQVGATVAGWLATLL